MVCGIGNVSGYIRLLPLSSRDRKGVSEHGNPRSKNVHHYNASCTLTSVALACGRAWHSQTAIA